MLKEENIKLCHAEDKRRENETSKKGNDEKFIVWWDEIIQRKVSCQRLLFG